MANDFHSFLDGLGQDNDSIDLSDELTASKLARWRKRLKVAPVYHEFGNLVYMGFQPLPGMPNMFWVDEQLDCIVQLSTSPLLAMDESDPHRLSYPFNIMWPELIKPDYRAMAGAVNRAVNTVDLMADKVSMLRMQVVFPQGQEHRTSELLEDAPAGYHIYRGVVLLPSDKEGTALTAKVMRASLAAYDRAIRNED